MARAGVAMARTEDVECWAQMADAFDFGDVDHTKRDVPTVCVPVPWLENMVPSAAENAEESLETLGTRFAQAFRGNSPCVTRRAAEPWMSSSRLGIGGGDAVFGPNGAARAIPVVMLENSVDGKTFLGKGDWCTRRENVLGGDAWAAVTQRGGDATHQVHNDRCYFRVPLGPELWRDVDFRAACAIFGNARDDDEKPMARSRESHHDETEIVGGPPPAPFSQKTSSVWVSSPGCVTPTHFDLCHGLLTQIRGKKRVLLVPPWHTRSMHRLPPGGVNPNSSPVNLSLYVFGVGEEKEKRDFSSKTKTVSGTKTKRDARLEDARAERGKHAKTRTAFGEIRDVTLTPGDTLYIPPFWWHHVVTLPEAGANEGHENENEDEKKNSPSSTENRNNVSVSLLLAFDPIGDEGVHPCVEDL